MTRRSGRRVAIHEAKMPRPTSISVQSAMSVVAQSQSGSAKVWRKGIRMMVAELALHTHIRKCHKQFGVQKGETYMQATPKIPTTMNFVRLSICKFQTRNIGKIPTVKSHIPAKTLQSQLIAMTTFQSIH
jgi:hypothetical protein